VTGCYFGSSGDGQISGDTDGRVMHVQWNQTDASTGSLVMVAADGARQVNGVWYRNGSAAGVWFGSRIANRKPACPGVQSGQAGIASALKATGRALLYGVHFPSDSDQLTPDSAEALKAAASVLAAQPAQGIVVRGYTDSTHTDAYNLALSKRRADAVAKWLSGHGVTAGRLTTEGLGKADPVADNATADGRALNRRVELVARK
jgi:outer membrane protein OmpA-like peptidoglycan-associated protein